MVPGMEVAYKCILHRGRNLPGVFFLIEKRNTAKAWPWWPVLLPFPLLFNGVFNTVSPLLWCGFPLLYFHHSKVWISLFCSSKTSVLQVCIHVWKFAECLYCFLHTQIQISQAWLKYSSSLIVRFYIYDKRAGILESNCSPKLSKFSF